MIKRSLLALLLSPMFVAHADGPDVIAKRLLSQTWRSATLDVVIDGTATSTSERELSAPLAGDRLFSGVRDQVHRDGAARSLHQVPASGIRAADAGSRRPLGTDSRLRNR